MSSTPAALHLAYVRTADLTAQPEDHDLDDALALVGYARPPLHPQSAPVPSTASMTPALGAGPERCELWRVSGGDSPLRNGLAHPLAIPAAQVRYRHDGTLLFGALIIDEARFSRTEAVPSPQPTHATSLEQATLAAYGEIFEILEASDHPHLVRVWNYLPDINRESQGEERYRQFNVARQRALRASGRSVEGNVPAASALGTAAGSPLSIYFLASREEPLMIENPRQMSAYHYPRTYGPVSPSFSRACVLERVAGTNLFVSGTASIVGHESLHPGDVVAQTQETLANLEALLAEANRRLGGPPRYALESLKLKVYVRRPEDLPRIERALEEVVHPRSPPVYLQADICRSELLVEIEATGESAATPG
jgi:enamine deaminase RidA (YjgF/YER057c/UK114 family)